MCTANPFAGLGHRGGVVAGCDGSDHAREAVRWAAAEAACRHCALLLVHAHLTPVTNTWGTVATPGWGGAPIFDDTHLVRQAEEHLDAVAEECRREEPGLGVGTIVVAGRASPALAEAARTVNAELLVVGMSGLRALPRALLGSTATDLVHHAHRPVAAVRGVPVARNGPVVVGVGDTTASLPAVHFASGYAERRACELRHVHDDPVDALLQQSEHAQLLVVSDHSHGAVHRALFGSASHAALYNASCPVVVVPSAS